MSSSQTICSLCGGSDMNLVDGYYYCSECGTQDMTLQQTVLEATVLADGTMKVSQHKKKILELKENVEMAPEWHKWHTYNFILSGLADELIALGAKPSFKTKLLWIWARYLSKYYEKGQNAHEPSVQGSADDENVEREPVEEDVNGEREALDEDDTDNEEKPYKPGMYAYNTDIKLVTLGLFYAMCYIGLNLDENDIQLSDLCRFIREEKVSRKNCFKFIPKGLDIHAIPKWQNFMGSTNLLYLNRTINYLSFVLFKKLDLGSPKVPDFHKIVDKFITELCLPKGIKYIVLALVKQVKYTFKNNQRTAYIPDYEILAMAYILMAMKLCFGLDDDYEIKLSDAVEKINNDEFNIKSHSGICNETEKLFSFREWYNYIELRKIILSKYNTNMAVHNNQEVDDELYVYEMKDRFKRSCSVKVGEKIVMEILDKIKLGAGEIELSKIDFKGSLTPLSSYTETLLSHTNDPNLQLMLTEDFSAYSISYIINGLDLRVDGKNILVGVSKEGKIVHEHIKGNISSRRAGSPVAYVRNCENKNWLITKPPKQEHITETKEDIDDVTDGHGDFKITPEVSETEKMIDTVDHLETSTLVEEDSDLNIFDDSFKDIKDEDNADQTSEHLFEEGNLNDQITNALECADQLHRENSGNSSSHLSKILDRDEFLRALIVRKCQEFNIPLPSDMNLKPVLKRKRNEKGPRIREYKNRAKIPVEMTTHDIISSYITKLQNDFTLVLEESWKKSLNDCMNQNTLNYGSIELTLNKTDNDANSINETQRQISSCGIMETNDDDSVVILNDDVIMNDEKAESPVPKSNPEFDENIYDVNQLYVKMKDRDIGKVFSETDPRLFDLLDKQSNKEIEKKTRQIKKMISINDNSIENEKLEVLINLKYNVEEYRYWIRHYARYVLVRNRFINQRFEDELDNFFPKSFTYVLRLCASILECSTVVLYSQLCRHEMLLKRKKKEK